MSFSEPKIEIPKKPEEEAPEEALPPELIPYRDEMKEWVDAHIGELKTFLQYPEAEFTIKYGKGFSYNPDTDEITLDVSFYKESREKGHSIERALMFGAMHEVAHNKTQWECDPAGRHNYAEHLGYLRRKFVKAEASDPNMPSHFGNLVGAYFHFFNLMEDCIVNHLVMDTRYFAKNGSVDERRNFQSIQDAYLTDLFVIYRNVGPGKGMFVKNPNPLDKQRMLNVGEGRGEYVIMERADYDRGFDWKKDGEKDSHAGQFLTFVMKAQNSYLRTDEIQSPENPDGRHILTPDATVALTRPISEVYRHLLKRIFEKYKNEPEKLKRYVELMKKEESISIFKEQDGRPQKVGAEDFWTVLPPTAILKGGLDLNFSNAGSEFERRIRALCDDFGIKNGTDLSFLQLLDKLKTKDFSKSYGFTIPLRYNLTDRCRAYRLAFEPIFCLLSILDDKFNVPIIQQAPPLKSAKPSKDGEKEKKKKSPERPVDFEPGHRVINNVSTSPYYKKKGIIEDVTRRGGKVVAVTIKYYDESAALKMAASAIHGFEADVDVVANPYDKDAGNNKSRVIMQKPEEGGSGGSPQKANFDSEDNENKEKDKPGEGENEPQPKKDNPEQGDIGGAIAELDKQLGDLRKMMDKDARKANLKDLQNEKQTQPYKQKESQKGEESRLFQEMLKHMAREGQINISEEHKQALRNRIKEYLEMRNNHREAINEMGKNWEDVVKNIASQVQLIRKGWFAQYGKMDVQRLAKIYPQLAAGKQIDAEMLYKRLVEKMLTEIMPKALRVSLIVDNSGSMSGEKMEAVKVVVLLLRESLRSLRFQFREKMKQAFGTQQSFDFFCDFEIHLFGSNNKTIKDFQVDDLGFLESQKSRKPAPFPKLDVVDEDIRTLLAYERMLGNGGGTNILPSLESVAISRNEPTTKRMIKSGFATEMVFVISDGDLNQAVDQSVETVAAIKAEMPLIHFVGFGIGASEAETSGAVEQLRTLLGENVYPANPPALLVTNFKKILKEAVKSQVQDKIIEKLKQSAQAKS